jgi:hypothetical protein
VTLREARVLFTRLKAEWVSWAFTEGYLLAEDEGRIITPRRVAYNGTSYLAHDRVHKKNSNHHIGLAADFLLYEDLDGDGDRDDYVSMGGTKLWQKLGEKWESMHPLCRSGIRFGDDNHISVEWDGRQ